MSPTGLKTAAPLTLPSPHRMGREFPEMKIRALKPLNRGKTSNVQHRTPKAEVSEEFRCHSMFGVGCSMLDVPLGSWGLPRFAPPCIRAMNGGARLRRAPISQRQKLG